MEARVAAKRAATLEELRETLKRFEGCALSATATQLVFADGRPGARVMFVGEAPGAEEDREGLPFVGRSGKLLDRMIAAIGMKRSEVYIANIVPWRPPGNRTPTPQESAICLPFIRRQIELADPDFLVVMGKPAMQTLLGINEGIRGVRGRWVDYDTGTRTIRALVMFHPAYLLRSPNEKRHSWRDFLALKKALKHSRVILRSERSEPRRMARRYAVRHPSRPALRGHLRMTGWALSASSSTRAIFSALRHHPAPALGFASRRPSPSRGG